MSPLHQPAGRAEGDKRRADDVEAKRADIEIPDLSHLSDTVDLGSPAFDVVDPDQAGIQIGDDVFARPAGIDIAETTLAELQHVADAEPPVLVLEAGKNFAARFTDDMAIRQGEYGFAVRHQTSYRPDVDLALRLVSNGKAAADEIAFEQRRIDAAGAPSSGSTSMTQVGTTRPSGRYKREGTNSDADDDFVKVGAFQPLFDENQHARPSTSPSRSS